MKSQLNYRIYLKNIMILSDNLLRKKYKISNYFLDQSFLYLIKKEN